MSQGLALTIACVCVVANGFFVTAEFAIVKVRRARVEELLLAGANRRARVLHHVLGHLDAYLAACQLGITFASLTLGWLGGPAIAALIQPLFAGLGAGHAAVAAGVAFVLAFVAIAFVHLLLGQLAPKSVAVRHPERSALAVAYPLRAFAWAMFPFIWLLNTAANGLLRVVGVQSAAASELAHSEEELRMIVASSHESGVLDKYERELLDNVFDFSEHTVHEVMVPRTVMACLFTDHAFEDNMRVVRETMHTRYPLVQGDKDHVIGMIHLKDLYLALQEHPGSAPDLAALRRDILAVPETLSISLLLGLFRKRHVHMAVAVDEYGGTSGLITLEDLLEEIVGEIEDEFDTDEEEDTVVADGSSAWRVDGALPLRDLTKLTGERFDEEDVDTVGGLVMHRLGRIPRQGESFVFGIAEYTVLRMEGRRVGRVGVRLTATIPAAAAAPAPPEPAAD